jgi:hypothetical protein
MVTRRRRTAPPVRRSASGKLRAVPTAAANLESEAAQTRRRVRPTMIAPHGRDPDPDAQ